MDKDRLELFNAGLRQLSSTFDVCLWPVDECEKEAIRAHSVQNKKVLEQLCDKNHVVMPRFKVSANKIPVFYFDSVGRNKATTFTGLCAAHDSELFKGIDNELLDVNNNEHLFLISYRSLIREVHSSRKSAIDTQFSYKQGVERGIYPDEPCAPGMLAVEMMMAAYLVEEVRGRFNKIYLNKHYEKLSHFPITLGMGPTIAVSSMFSTGLWCPGTDSVAFLTLNVFPDHRGISEVVFSCINEHEPQVKEYITPILEASGHYRLYLLSKLILEKCENLVISPVLFQSYSEQQKEVISRYFERNTFGQTYIEDSKHLFLFEPVH